MVLHEWIERNVPDRRSHCDERELASERHEAFDQRWRAGNADPRSLEIGALANDGLTFSVVSEPSRLEDRGHAHHRQGSSSFSQRIGGRGASGGNSERLEARLFFRPVLRCLQCTHRWANCRSLGDALDSRDRNALELVRGEVETFGEMSERRLILVFRDDELRARPGRRLRIRREKPHLDAKTSRCNREHLAELSRAEYSYSHPVAAGSGWSRTVCV